MCDPATSMLPVPIMQIRVPPGATGIMFDRLLYRFVVSFNGASDEFIGQVVGAGMPLEDRVMFVDVPVFVGTTLLPQHRVFDEPRG